MVEFTRTITYTVDCPACQDSRVIKVGQRNGYQRYQCQACNKKFKANGQAEGRKYDAELIGATIYEVIMGLSYRNSARNIANRYDIPTPSTDTIFNWIKDYTEAASYALKDVKAHTGDAWVADEIYMDADGEEVYHWNVMDRDTRFLLASHVSRHRDADGATAVFKKALARADHPPKTVRTDGLDSYSVAMRRLIPDAKHIKSKGASHWINNNLSERMQGTYRQRIKTARGLGSVASAQQFMDAFNVTYNYLREHGALKGKTPAQAAAIDSPFSEWADVVRANIEVPEDWKRKPEPRMHRVKRYRGHTKKGYRKHPQKKREDEPQSPRVQLGFWKHKRPTKRDREKAAMTPVRAPRAVMPNVQFGGQGRRGDRQLQMMSTIEPMVQTRRLPRLVPARMRPKPPGRKRK